MIYLGLYGSLLFGGAISARRHDTRRFLFIAFCIILFCFVAFRYEVGCDWHGYWANFEIARNLYIVDVIERGREVGYWLFLTQLHEWGFEYPYLNLFMAVLFFWGLIALANRQPDPLAFLILSFPVLIINMPMSAIRQSTAIGLVCLALIAFQDRRLIRFVAFVAAAALFHTSAIIFLALAPFTKMRLTRATVALSIVLVLPGAYFMFADTAEFYADRYVGTGIDAAGGLYRAGMLAVVGAFFLIALRRPYQERFPGDYQLALIGAWIMVATLAILPISSVISDRFGYYITPVQLMIMARLPYLVPNTSKGRFIAAAPYAGLALVLLVWTANSYHFQQCYLPYQTWLSWEY